MTILKKKKKKSFTAFWLFCEWHLTQIYMSIFQDLTKKWSEVRQLVPQRDATLQAELRKQQNNEMLRRQFAEKANQVGPWIERQMDAVTAIGMGMQGSLEDQLHRLKEYEQGVYAYKPHIEELEKIHQAVQEGMIFENR